MPWYIKKDVVAFDQDEYSALKIKKKKLKKLEYQKSYISWV